VAPIQMSYPSPEDAVSRARAFGELPLIAG